MNASQVGGFAIVDGYQQPVRIVPKLYTDSRGSFFEAYNAQRYAELDLPAFVQDNHSRSFQRVIRGMHYQPGQAKLVRCARGTIYDVIVDIRPASSTLGTWYGTWLDDLEHAQLFVPDGFAHGFQVLSDHADVVYKVSTPYDTDTESGFNPHLEVGSHSKIRWPTHGAIVSERDRRACSFADRKTP